MSTASDIKTLTKQIDAVTANVTALTQEVVSLKAADAVTQQEIIMLEARTSALELSVAALEAVEPPPVEPPVEPPIEPPVEPPLPTDTGWTVFTPSADTRKVYVSNSVGNDANDGLSEAKPVKTIKKGFSLTRHNFPDWLLLKKGDVWTDETIGWISGINSGTARSGRSATEPMLFSSYGTGARPLIKTNPSVNGAAAISTNGGGGGQGGNFVAFVGLEFYAHTRDPKSPTYNAATITSNHQGTHLLLPITWMLIEDCKFSFYQNNLIIQTYQAVSEKVILRRNIIVDAYSTNSHSQGIYTEAIKDLVLEENLIDHNGWNEIVTGGGRTQYNHGLYHSAHLPTGPVTMRGNIFSRNSSHGANVNYGGEVTNNLFFRNAIGQHFKIRADGALSKFENNVITESDDRDPGDGVRMGWGVTLGTMDLTWSGGIAVTGNVIAHNASTGTNQMAIDLGPMGKGITVTGNAVYKWQNPIVGTVGSNVTTPNLVDAGGTGAVAFIDPSRTVAKYKPDFINGARLQSKDNWRSEYTAGAVNNYIRAGFAAA